MTSDQAKESIPARSNIRRRAYAVPDEAAEILARGTVAHVGFVQKGQPFVLPFAYHYDPAVPDRMYLHGSPASRALLHLGTGEPVCVTVTLVDGLVYSRTAIFHSMNYRSTVCFGRAHMVEAEVEKQKILEELIARHFKGRKAGRDYESAPPEHLRLTMLVEIQIEEMSAKARRGGAKGPHDADTQATGTSGVVQLAPHDLPLSTHVEHGIE